MTRCMAGEGGVNVVRCCVSEDSVHFRYLLLKHKMRYALVLPSVSAAVSSVEQ